MTKSDSTARFHSPADLLATARSLLNSGDEDLLRASILEAITALESMTAATVFPLLEKTLPSILVKWLKGRTRMDFDTRLSVLASVATGREVDKGSDLWARYKAAKSIRNEVTHLGRRITFAEAGDIIATVEAWIHFLGSTAEVSLSLEALRDQLAELPLEEVTEANLVWNIAGFYRSAHGVKVLQEIPLHPDLRPDAVLQFGEELVVLEIKVARGATEAMAVYSEVVTQAERYLQVNSVSKVAVFIIFSGVQVPEDLSSVKTMLNGKISIIGIQSANH